jgi:hypothetical protein
VSQLVEVEGQSGRWQLESYADLPRGHPIVAGLNQQTKDLEPRLLGERAQSLYSV